MIFPYNNETLFAERKRQPTPIKELDRGLCDEEDWNIKDCVIVEDGKAANPVGRVIKIDGSFAAVKFSNTSDPVDDPLHNVRLLRKEDLQVSGRNLDKQHVLIMPCFVQ